MPVKSKLMERRARRKEQRSGSVPDVSLHEAPTQEAPPEESPRKESPKPIGTNVTVPKTKPSTIKKEGKEEGPTTVTPPEDSNIE